MALCSPPVSPSPAVPANHLASSPSSSFLPASPSISPTQPRPTLVQRRGIQCRSLRISACRARPDTPITSLPPPASTLYQVLQVPQTATKAEIKAAYRRLVRLYHPDSRTAVADEGKNKEESTSLFLQIHSAYAALSDAQSRANYDLQLSAQALRDRIGCTATPRSVGYSYPKPRASPSYSPCTTRLGRSWETDQCWC
eukprot:c24364_g1_i2 orf=749-1342(-)